MASKKNLQKVSGDVFDMMFSQAAESSSGAPETAPAESSGEPEKTAQRADRKPEKKKKKVFSFRAEADQVDSWRVWADAKGMKVDELGEKALREYIERHPLTKDQKTVYELKLSQRGGKQ